MRAHAQDFRAEVQNDWGVSALEADKLTHQLASDWRTAKLSKSDRALCGFAAKLTESPESMDESHILDLRTNGFSDAAVHDASQVVSYFNYINRIADSLNVDLEEDVHAWELTAPT